MSVVTNDPIAIALDRIAMDLVAPIRDYIQVRSLWSLVMRHALDVGDTELALLAAREAAHADRAERSLSPP